MYRDAVEHAFAADGGASKALSPPRLKRSVSQTRWIGLTATIEHDIEMDSGESVPLSCDLSALDVAQRKRRFLLDQLLQVGTVDIVELPDGYAFHVDPVSIIAQHLEELAALERLCCPFLTIAVRAGAVDAQLVLEIGGGDAVKEFIAAQFGIRRQRTH